MITLNIYKYKVLTIFFNKRIIFSNNCNKSLNNCSNRQQLVRMMRRNTKNYKERKILQRKMTTLQFIRQFYKFRGGKIVTKIKIQAKNKFFFKFRGGNCPPLPPSPSASALRHLHPQHRGRLLHPSRPRSPRKGTSTTSEWTPSKLSKTPLKP